MASFFNIGSRFGRQAPKSPLQPSDKQPSPTSSTPQSLPFLQPIQTNNSGRFTPTLQSPTTDTPSMSSIDNMQSMSNFPSPGQNGARRPPPFFREENSTLIVKGNFMTLAAQPIHIDRGEWLAHQVVEQYRLLESWIKIIQETDKKTNLPICNTKTCPTMSAGGYIYTWLDKQRNPVKIPAFQYIQLVQQWTMGKISDARLFPIDTDIMAASPVGQSSNLQNLGAIGSAIPMAAGPTNLNLPLATLAGNVDKDWLGKVSGFPESFAADIRNLYRQMFRCYAHLYHSHWVEPFWHLGATKELNTCFLHFINVGKLFDLLEDKDIVPMQPLIEIWLAKGLLPKPGQDPHQQLSGGAKVEGNHAIAPPGFAITPASGT